MEAKVMPSRHRQETVNSASKTSAQASFASAFDIVLVQLLQIKPV